MCYLCSITLEFRDENQKPSNKNKKCWLDPAVEDWRIKTVWFPLSRWAAASAQQRFRLIHHHGWGSGCVQHRPVLGAWGPSVRQILNPSNLRLFVQDSTTSVNTCSSSACRPDSRSHLSASEIHINVNLSSAHRSGRSGSWTWLEERRGRQRAAVTLPTKLSFFDFGARSLPTCVTLIVAMDTKHIWSLYQ